jgi:hypothetical protein
MPDRPGPDARNPARNGDPVRLLEGDSGSATLLRGYRRWTRPTESENAVAWRRLRAEIDRPAPPRRSTTTLCSGLAAACLAAWLLAPAHPTSDHTSLAAAGGTSGTATPTGGTEGTSGRPRRP